MQLAVYFEHTVIIQHSTDAETSSEMTKHLVSFNNINTLIIVTVKSAIIRNPNSHHLVERSTECMTLAAIFIRKRSQNSQCVAFSASILVTTNK